jgi:hypothetical protein
MDALFTHFHRVQVEEYIRGHYQGAVEGVVWPPVPEERAPDPRVDDKIFDFFHKLLLD